MSRDHFAKLLNNCQIGSGFKKINLAITFFSFISDISNS